MKFKTWKSRTLPAKHFNFMKAASSLISLRKNDLNSKIVKRRGRVYQINKIIENMTVLILAGGLGSRINQHTKNLPKPMIRISGEPIISHIINHYKSYGLNKFIIASGYKSEVIENYFKK